VGLLRTADQVRRAGTLVVEPFGITGQQYNVLRILRGAGEAGLPTLEISGRMIEQTPGITRLIDRLETKRLVRRRPCPEDRRQVFCHITSEGLALLAALDQPVNDLDARVVRRLGREDQLRLIRLLDAVREGLA
ncbi:MAG: MarR family winged helix-turn-helix transcriptional regulator, partial [Gemmatimonadales bacterium]